MGLHLDERDARKLSRAIVTELRAIGMQPTEFGVHLEREGFWFLAVINGRTVWARTGQGQFTYRAVATELAAAALKAATDPYQHVA